MVPICKYVYYYFLQYVISHWRLTWKDDFSNLLDEVRRFSELDVYHYLGEPYAFDLHPDGYIVMRGGFGDFASTQLPKERFFLISPRYCITDGLAGKRLLDEVERLCRTGGTFQKQVDRIRTYYKYQTD